MLTQHATLLAAAAPGPRKRLVMFWATAGALAAVAVLPYLLAMNAQASARIPLAMPVFVLVQFLQGLVFLSLASWMGLRLGRGIGLGAPLVQAWLDRRPDLAWPGKTLAIAAGTGAAAGAAVMVLDKLFQSLMPATTLPGPVSIDLWKRLLACFYGGITEELICRLFLMTLLVWACRRLFAPRAAAPRTWMFWVGIGGAALLFGAAHLPAAAGMWPLTAVVVSRTVLLNGIGGLVFGALYWRRGLEHAMLAHFCADIVLHVVGGS